MNKLPKIFINKIDKEINNSMRKTIVNKNEISLDNILSKDKYPFNHVYSISLKDGNIIKDSIIQILDTKILTINNSWIDIKKINSIKEIKK